MGARGIMLQSPVTSRFSLPAPLKYPAGLAEDRTLSDAVGVAKNTTEKAAAEAELSVFKPLLPSEIRKFARIVFLYPVTSVIVEGLFSHMTYNHAGSRKGLGDDRCADVITCKDFNAVDADATTLSLRQSMNGRQP